MIIHNREVNFAFTVGAATELSELAPDGDISRLSEVLDSKSLAVRMDASMRLIAALSRGYEERAAYDTPSYQPAPLTLEELRTLDLNTVTELVREAFTAISRDRQTTVEVEPEHGKKTRARR